MTLPVETFRLRRAAAVALAAALAAAACGKDPTPVKPDPDHTPAVLVAVVNMLRLDPGETKPAQFRLTSLTGAAVPDERLDFAIVDDGPAGHSQPAGATLSASSALTDAGGTASVQVTGGLETVFRLRATHAKAGSADAEVFVSDEGGTLDVVPAVAGDGPPGAPPVVSVDVLLWDDRHCADLTLAALPAPTRLQLNVAPGAVAELAIDGKMVYAIAGQGRDAGGRLRAAGCIDVPGSTAAGAGAGAGAVRVYLPLGRLLPAPLGTYALTSHLTPAAGIVGGKLAAPWQDMGDCPLDPGQLWLDCAVDALGMGTNDPLDCVPSPAGDGELATALTARRTQTSASAPCRSPTLPSAAACPSGQSPCPSLDAKVAALFPSPAPSPARDLRALGAEAAALLDDVTIGSTLALAPTERADVFQATHLLRSATFAVGARSAPVDIVALGPASAEARFVPVTTRDDRLTVGSHGLGLRLGTLAHVAFADAALAARGLPRTAPALLEALFRLATTARPAGGGGAAPVGCDAMDAVACPEAGRPAGCLRAACAAGQAALGALLEASFAAADGSSDVDLVLSGSAELVDDDGDAVAERLGGGPLGAGLWSGELRADAATEALSGSWVGAR